MLANPGFEADRGFTQTPYGWQEWSDNGSTDASFVEGNGGGAGPAVGSYKGTHWKATPYRVYTYQVLSGLPNGLYTLTAQARRSGSATTAQMEAKEYGGPYRAAPILESSAYQTITLTDINVTNGQCTIGFWSDANGGTYTFFDDVKFFKQGTSSLASAPSQRAAKLTGTAIGTAGSWNNNGNTIAKVFDGDWTSFFDAPTGNGNWVGLDLGSAATLTQIKFAPRSGYASRMIGANWL